MRNKTCITVLLLLLLCLLSSCSVPDSVQSLGKGNEDTAPAEDTTFLEPEEGNTAYMVLRNDSAEEILRLFSYKDGQEYQFHYALSTNFFDKYGNLTSTGNITEGRIVTIGRLDPDGLLTSVKISEEVWEYPDIVRFSIDQSRSVFEIADTRYTWKNNLKVFSNGQQVGLSSISENDVLSVVGIGKQILSVVITTGHGMLALENTELFEGSFIQIGPKIFTLVTEDLLMELPEGNYTVAIANNGWGGVQDVAVERGKITNLDLDAMKGEGPSSSLVLFEVDVEEAKIFVDDEAIDYSEPVSLQYGKHTLRVSAPGYDTWDKILYVNSEEATVTITLNENGASDTKDNTEDSESTENSQTTENSESENSESENSESEEGGASESTGGNSWGTSSGLSSNTQQMIEDALSDMSTEDLKDYLSTFSAMMDVLN